MLTRMTRKAVVLVLIAGLSLLHGCGSSQDDSARSEVTLSTPLAPVIAAPGKSAIQPKSTVAPATPTLPVLAQLSVPPTLGGVYAFQAIDVSPDGKWLACWAGQEGNGWGLFVSPTTRARWRRIAAGAGTGSWRSDSSIYAFDRYTATEEMGGKIGLLRVPRLKMEVVKAPFHFMLSPSWTPDGRYLSVLCSDRWTGGPRRSYNPDPPQHEFKYLALLRPGGRVARLLPLEVGNSNPVAWSPNGKRGAFVSSRQKATGYGYLSIVSLQTGQIIHDKGDIYEMGDVDEIGWLNNEWLIEPKSVVVYRATLPKRTHTLTKGITAVSAWMPDNRGGFYVVTAEQKDQISYHVGRSELWQGVLAPIPRLTKRLASLPFTKNREDVVADFDPVHSRLWMLSPDGKSIRSYSTAKVISQKVDKPALPGR